MYHKKTVKKDSMKNLESVRKLKKNGKYKYVGFMLLTDPDTEKEIIGTSLSIFKDIKENEFYYIINTDIQGANEEKPYGCFQTMIGTFNSNYDIELDENNKWFIEDKDKPKAEVIED